MGVCDEHSDLYSAVLLHRLSHTSISSGADRCDPLCHGVNSCEAVRFPTAFPRTKLSGVFFLCFFSCF